MLLDISNNRIVTLRWILLSFVKTKIGFFAATFMVGENEYS